MEAITFRHLLNTARILKQRGWPLPMRLVYLAGMLGTKHETFLVNSEGVHKLRLLRKVDKS